MQTDQEVRMKAVAALTLSPCARGLGRGRPVAFTFTAVGPCPSSFAAAASCQDKTEKVR